MIRGWAKCFKCCAGGKWGYVLVTETFRLDKVESEVVGGACVLSVVEYGTVELYRYVTLLKATQSVCTTCELFSPTLGPCLPTVRRPHLRRYSAHTFQQKLYLRM